MAGVEIRITGAAELAVDLQAAAVQFQGPLDSILQSIGSEWTGLMREGMRSGGRPDAFAPLSPTTLDLRARGASLRGAGGAPRGERSGGGLSKPLYRTGALLNSIQILHATGDELAVGTTQPGATLLHHGGTTAPGSMLPNRPVPPRPFITLTEDDIALTIESLTDFLLGDLGGAQ